MSRDRPLRGACACGRNQYVVEAPANTAESAGLYFSHGSHSRHAASPLSAFLRVPLTWYRSTTFAFQPDETHRAIRRVYTHPSTPSAQRYFCGFCGTPLTYWSEQPREEAEWICVTLGSLRTEDLHSLEELGLLDREETEGREANGGKDEEATGEVQSSNAPRSLPWFDDLIKGSRLGTMSRRFHGVGEGQGGVRVEWEVVEYAEGEGDTQAGTPKRKLGEVEDPARYGHMDTS